MGRLSIATLLVVVLLSAHILTGCAGAAEGTAEWYVEQSNELLNQGQYDEAIKNCDEAIRLNPQLAKAYNSRGFAYDELDQFERAIEDYDEAIRLNPQYVMAYNNRGFAYGNMGQYIWAIQDYDEAIRLNPRYAEAYFNRGFAYHMQGKKAKAIADFEKSIRETDNPQLVEMADQQIAELTK